MATNETLTIKRTPFYLFLILLGFLLFYIFDLLRKHSTDEVIKVPTKAGIIPDADAKLMMNNYLQEQERGSAECRLVSGSKTLRGFWITKGFLHQLDSSILNENPKAEIVGYNIFLGKKDTSDKSREYNLVVRGTIRITNEKISTNSFSFSNMYFFKQQYEEAGSYGDMVDPIPPKKVD